MKRSERALVLVVVGYWLLVVSPATGGCISVPASPPGPPPTPSPIPEPTPEPTPQPCSGELPLCNQAPDFLMHGCCDCPPGEDCYEIPKPPGPVCDALVSVGCWEWDPEVRQWIESEAPPADDDLPGEDPPGDEPPADCGDLGITIDAPCAGATPDCDVRLLAQSGGFKTFVLELQRRAVLYFDASYFANGNPHHKVHKSDACYPGPVLEWAQHEQHVCSEADCHVDCGNPEVDGHRLRCGPFDFRYDGVFEVTGSGGASGKVRVIAR